jgi:hypothetical protein
MHRQEPEPEAVGVGDRAVEAGRRVRRTVGQHLRLEGATIVGQDLHLDGSRIGGPIGGGVPGQVVDGIHRDIRPSICLRILGKGARDDHTGKIIPPIDEDQGSRGDRCIGGRYDLVVDIDIGGSSSLINIDDSW